jgi:hypothetical protein
MIMPVRLFETRSSPSSFKLPLAFAIGSWIVLFFVSKAGLPPLSSPLALLACWFIEKRSFFTALIWISLLGAPLDLLWGTGGKMWMVCHTLASALTFGVQPGNFNFPSQMKWGIRVFFWSLALMSFQYILYSDTKVFLLSLSSFYRFFEFSMLALYDAVVFGCMAWAIASWLQEE